jgi:hypothetical protein
MTQIVAFPMTAQANEVRLAADALRALHGEAANAYWRQTIARLRRQLAEGGVDREDGERELRAFCNAVFARVRETGVPAGSEKTG